MKRIVFRGDDAGSSEGANLAMRQAVENGVLRNISVMAPGPAVHHAAQELRNLEGVNFGLHVTLNAEWDPVKWGPVLPTDQVPTLIDQNGWFTREPSVLQRQGFSVDEADREVRAQLALLRELGFRIDYLDEHMGVGWLPGLRDRLVQIALEEGLVNTNLFGYLPNAATGDTERLLAAIDEAPDQEPWVVVFHPLTNVDPVAKRFTFGGIQPGEVLRERAQDRRVLTDPRMAQGQETGRFRSLTYQEVAMEAK